MSLNHLADKKSTFIVNRLVTADDSEVKFQGPTEIGGTCFPENMGLEGQILTVDNATNCSKWEYPAEQLPKINIAGKILTSTSIEGQTQWEDLDVSAVQNISASAGVTNITGETNTEQLTFKAQDNEIINLSTIPNKGTAGYFLTSDGNSPPNLYWSPDGAGVTGVQQTQVPAPTTAQDKVMIYNSNDGLTCKSSNMQYISGIGLNMNQESIVNSLRVETNSISSVNPSTEITINDNLKVDNIIEKTLNNGVNVDGVKIQDARLINSSVSQNFLRLDAGSVALNSTGDMTLNSANETTTRINGIPKVTIRDTETIIENELNVNINGNPKLEVTDTETIINTDTTISNNLKVDNIIENTLDNGVNVDGLQIKDTQITNILDTSSKLVLNSEECALVNGNGSLGFNSNISGTTFRVESVPKIVLLNDDTTINNDLKVDNIVKNTIDNVNIEGSQFRTGGLATINELTVLDVVDVNNSNVNNVNVLQCNTLIKNPAGGVGPILNTSGFDMGSSTILNLINSGNPASATTKSYVDGLTNSLDTRVSDVETKTTCISYTGGGQADTTIACDTITLDTPSLVIKDGGSNKITINDPAGPTLHTTTISNNNITLNGTTKLSVASTRIQDCSDPVNPQDVATKNYVDNNSGGGSVPILANIVNDQAIFNITIPGITWFAVPLPNAISNVGMTVGTDSITVIQAGYYQIVWDTVITNISIPTDEINIGIRFQSPSADYWQRRVVALGESAVFSGSRIINMASGNNIRMVVLADAGAGGTIQFSRPSLSMVYLGSV